MIMEVTSAQITHTISSLDRTVSELEAEAKDPALQAVGGDEGARRSLADILARIERARQDRAVLKTAVEAAGEREAAAAREAEEAHRVRHLGDARAHAGRLVEIAARADVLISDFRAALGELQEAEHAVWTALGAAKAAPADAIVGRRHIEQLAIERMSFMLQGLDRLRPHEPGVADRAKVAWSCLIADEADA